MGGRRRDDRKEMEDKLGDGKEGQRGERIT